MLIIGVKGHAKEILLILENLHYNEEIYFYDDISVDIPELLYGKYKIIRRLEEAKELFRRDIRFVLGVGNPIVRKKLSDKFVEIGGKLESIIAPTALIGKYNVVLEGGLNIMHNVFISNDVIIGEGSLVNASASIHHDVEIGKFCEISPGAILTGACKIGNFTFIGAGAVILPKLRIGSNVIIGAGAVVVSDIPDRVVAVGVPAKVIKHIEEKNHK